MSDEELSLAQREHPLFTLEAARDCHADAQHTENTQNSIDIAQNSTTIDLSIVISSKPMIIHGTSLQAGEERVPVSALTTSPARSRYIPQVDSTPSPVMPTPVLNLTGFQCAYLPCAYGLGVKTPFAARRRYLR